MTPPQHDLHQRAPYTSSSPWRTTWRTTRENFHSVRRQQHLVVRVHLKSLTWRPRLTPHFRKFSSSHRDDTCRFPNNSIKQESLPAWMQEAYLPPCCKSSLCCCLLTGRGGVIPIQSWRGGGIPPIGRMGYPPPRKCGQTENIIFPHPSDAGGNNYIAR